MELLEKLPGRSSRARRHRRATAAKATAGVVGAGAVAAVVVKARRSHGNGQGPKVHTTPQEGHPAGTGVRSDRDIGGPTAPNQGATGDFPGGAPGTPPESGFEPHS